MTSFSKISQEKQGELFIFFEAILWGLFPVILKNSISEIPPMFSASMSLFLSLLFFMPIIQAKQSWREFTNKDALAPTILSSLIIGCGFYSLVYLGSAQSNPTNVSILLLLEVFSTTVILHFFGGEKLSWYEMAGSTLIILASAIVIFPGHLSLNFGDLLIILAVLLAPLGNFYNKKARGFISAPVILTMRNLLSGIFMLIISTIFETFPENSAINNSLLNVTINGILIFGLSKILWVEGIHRIQISKAIGINSIFPIITMIASYFMLSSSPTIAQIIALLPALTGIWFITRRKDALMVIN